MRIRPWHKLLLAAVLVFGQWLAIAHDYQHPALGSDQACQVCVHGQSFQAGPTTLSTATIAWLASETPWITPDPQPLARRHLHASIRAPPAHLV